jgi:hypothetical protein
MKRKTHINDKNWSPHGTGLFIEPTSGAEMRKIEHLGFYLFPWCIFIHGGYNIYDNLELS